MFFSSHCEDLTIYEQHGGCLIRSKNCLPFVSTWVHLRWFFDWVLVAHLFSLLYCSIMCLYVLCSVLWSQLRLQYKNYVRFVFISSCLYEGSCLIYVICVWLRIVVSNTYCVVFLLCFSSSCVPNIASFSRLSLFDLK
jgi:hypothetical protein